jgi:predicted nucleic acid-binding protein
VPVEDTGTPDGPLDEDPLTDCTSFVVMKELRLKDALTTDRHFRQMGFHTLP